MEKISDTTLATMIVQTQEFIDSSERQRSELDLDAPDRAFHTARIGHLRDLKSALLELAGRRAAESFNMMPIPNDPDDRRMVKV